MRMKFLAPIAALALAAGLGTAAQAATTVTSTFATGAEGWKFGSYQGGSTDVTWDSATQTIAKINHGFNGWGFLASTAYLGDKSAFLNGSFSFDLSDNQPSQQYATRPALVLTGANGKTIFAKGLGLPGPNLSNFDISLKASSFYTGSPTNQLGSVSSADFAAILADLEQVQIWADWTPNVETVRLDNVKMAVNTGVPEPATWALMIMGFGAAGVTLRRRRTGLAAA
ncbi:MAG: PEPxxWA-CTERM sorting domain-containing protein [Pseudomonadota bacterium]